MNYSNNISALQQQMMQGAEILARESVKTKEYRSDGYVNLLNKYGTSRDSSSHYVFQADAMTMDSALTEAYEGNGLFTKIIDRPAEEAVKRGFDLGIKDQDVLTYLSDKLDDLDWEQNASQALKWTRLYGGALMVMVINDGRNIWEPVDWEHVRGIEELRVYERPLVNPDYHSIYRSVSNETGRTSRAKFGMPEYYQVSSVYGTFRVHESRCLVFRNGVLPENSLNTQYRFWGIPEYYRIKRNLQETYTAHGNGVKLLDRCVQAIYKMRNLSNLLLTDGGEDQVLKRLNAIDMARGILNTMIIDADGEDYDFKQMSMSGVRDIIDSTCTMLSAVTNIPQTILFGRSPAGMNSTGEGDTENYYNMVEGLQKLNLKANGRTLLDLIFTEGVVTGQLQQKPKYKTEFEKLWSLSEKEQAELDKMKADTELVKAQTAQIYVELQVLNPEEIRAGLSKDDTFYVEDLLSDEDLDLSGVGSPLSVLESTNVELSTDNILQAIEDGTEDTTGILPEDITATDSETETVEDILESIEEGSEDSSAVLMCDPEIDEIIEEIEGENTAEDIADQEDDKQPQDLDVGVGVLVIKDGKILVAERSDGKGWCGPGGHMQVNEDTMQAALREIYEEFDILPREMLPVNGCTIALDGSEEINQFYCTDFEGEPQADEHEMFGAKFVSLEELAELPLFPPFAEAVNKFLDMIQPQDMELDRADFDEGKVKRDKNGRFATKDHDVAEIDYRAEKVTFKNLQEWKKSIGNVTEDEYSIIDGMSDTGYIKSSNSYKINKAMREGTVKELSEGNQKTIKTLKEVINKNVSDTDAVLIRKVDRTYLESVYNIKSTDLKDIVDEINTKKTGETYIEKGFVSTSYKADKNINLNDEIELDIYAPKGTNMFLTKNRTESEIILQANTRFELEGAVLTDDGKARVLMKVVDQLDRADWDESKVKREKNGRFGAKPTSEKQGNATKALTNPKQKNRMNVSESLPMTDIEKRKVTHDINNLFHAKYKGKRNCVIRTSSNEPDSPSYYYKFKNHGFDDYDIYHKTEID